MPTPRTPELTEAQFQTQVRDLAILTGWLTYHTHDSRRSDSGFPDLVCVSPVQQRVIFAELKTTTGRISPSQRTWLSLLAAAGCETALWRPRDLEEIRRILQGRRISTLEGAWHADQT